MCVIKNTSNKFAASYYKNYKSCIAPILLFSQTSPCIDLEMSIFLYEFPNGFLFPRFVQNQGRCDKCNDFAELATRTM